MPNVHKWGVALKRYFDWTYFRARNKRYFATSWFVHFHQTNIVGIIRGIVTLLVNFLQTSNLVCSSHFRISWKTRSHVYRYWKRWWWIWNDREVHLARWEQSIITFHWYDSNNDEWKMRWIMNINLTWMDTLMDSAI